MSTDNLNIPEYEEMQRALEQLKMLDKLTPQTSTDPIVILSGRNPYFSSTAYSSKE